MKKHEKEVLDRQTSYLTFLPHMDDGFHTGYQTVPGVVSDRNRRPREWLESLARNMQTQNRDVGYSIPDVQAAEQQLRRLARLHPDEALKHQQMIDYRALLALLLLWDTWEQDEAWPKLELHDFSEAGTAFSDSVFSALNPARAAGGLKIFTLRSARQTQGDVRPLAMLSQAMIIAPAAEPGDLSALLPAGVTWYDRSSGRFVDPCGAMDALSAFRLLARLRVLQALHEDKQWQSLILNSDPQLGGVLERFAADLIAAQQITPDENSLRLRTLAAHTFAQTGALPVEMRTARSDEPSVFDNPLLTALAPGRLPACPADTFSFCVLEGLPFACSHTEWLYAPMCVKDEPSVLARLQKELDLLQRHDPRWRRAAAQMLRALRQDVKNRTGLNERLPVLLSQWADELEAIPAAASRELVLDYPLTNCPVALRTLLGDMLGMEDESFIRGVFSDSLLLMQGECPYESEDHCRVDGSTWALAPLSPRLCRWLMDTADLEGLYAPLLDEVHFEKNGAQITASFRILRRSRELGSAPVSAVTFRRTYTIGASAATGTAVLSDQRPGVTVWPNARFTPGVWKQYFVFAQQPDQVSVWTLDSDWVQGELYRSAGTAWQTACSSRFPAFVALKRGELSLGALINDIPRRLLKHEPAAAIAVDFGSISTTVMLRQGERVQPAVLPECMHQTLLKGTQPSALAEAFLPQDVLLPGSAVESTYYSLMDMFSDESERWTGVLRDGHIYYRTTLEALTCKSAGALYYDLKWSDELYARSVMRLFLKQAMLQGALAARLWGSSSAAWRVSMPNAMPLHRQESYLELMRGLAREIAAETGLPLTPGVPAVLYATENQADGLYFLSRSEINARSGYLNLDIGGSTVDVSLWLGETKRATIESSLLLGCRQMLFESLLEWHAQDFNADFSDDALRSAITTLTHAWQAEGSTVRGRRKCMLLLDDLLATQAQTLRNAMENSRANGHISYFESLLLFHIGFLFYLAGELLERACADEDTRALLPEKMEICIAGNGGQMMKLFSADQHTRLCSLALARLNPEHPLKVLLPIQSRHPKQEVARGLLCSDSSLQSALSGVSPFNGTREGSEKENLVLNFLTLFYHVFPQAAQRLMPTAFEDDGALALRGTAAIELDTIFANSTAAFPADDMAMYVHCLDALKRLWHI